jgi:hypothetical protein
MLGGNDKEDDLRFATVARLSEMNQSAYRTILSPMVRAFVTEQSAEWLRWLHPHRVRFEIFSDKNPWLKPLAGLAQNVRAARKPVAPDNPFVGLQETVSAQIVDALDRYRDMRDRATEAFFLNFYGSPAVQALVGLRSDAATTRLHVGRDVAREAAEAKGLADLEARIDQGGLLEAGLRALLYVGGGEERPGADERVFATLRQLRQRYPESRDITLSRFKEIVREQFLLLRYDGERALALIPRLLPDDAAKRQAAIDAIRLAAEAIGELPEAAKRRLARIETLFGANSAATPAAPGKPAAEGSPPTRVGRTPVAGRAGSSAAPASAQSRKEA